MLVLARKLGETICLSGGISVTVTQVGNTVKLGIVAPDHIRIWRKELGDAEDNAARRPEVSDQDCSSV